MQGKAGLLAAGNVAVVARHRLLFVLFAALAAFAVTPYSASGDSGQTHLVRVTSLRAADSSIELILDFDAQAPPASVIRSGERDLTVIFPDATLAKNVKIGTLHIGNISSGFFAGFNNIGLRLDLKTRDSMTRITTERFGKTVVVHVPPLRSETAAAPAPTARPVSSSGLVTAVVRLSYADVSEIAGTLVRGAVVPSTDTFTATSPFAALGQGSSDSGSRSSNETPPPKAPAYVSIQTANLVPKDTPQGVRFDDHVAVDRRLNAVILTGTPEQVDAYKSIIAALDVPSRSVLLETQIVELTTSAAKDIGIDYAAGGTKFATATFGPTSGVTPKGGLSASAALSALEQTGQAKIIARPRIVALNNKAAAILSGEAVPIFTSIVIPGGSSTVIQNQIQYINVGVSLQILPRIAYDGRITAQIFCEVSSIIDFTGNTPRIAVRQELTSAVVSDSESLIVGGLLQENELKEMKKVPSLGNLPLVGQFFRDQTENKQSTNLYIIVTPHIISNGINGPVEERPAAPLALPSMPPDDSHPGLDAEPLTPTPPPARSRR